MSSEFIISAHSQDTEETFIVPNNITLVFYANEKQKCIVTHSKTGLDFVVDRMRKLDPSSPNIKHSGSVVTNYVINGFNRDEWMYVYKINFIDGQNGYNTPKILDDELQKPIEHYTLNKICNMINRLSRSPGTHITIYCSFCRGIETGNDYGIFDTDIDAFKIGDIQYESDGSQNEDLFDVFLNNPLLYEPEDEGKAEGKGKGKLKYKNKSKKYYKTNKRHKKRYNTNKHHKNRYNTIKRHTKRYNIINRYK
jgi:hypothetical protein